jgi:hypothetical protein
MGEEIKENSPVHPMATVLPYTYIPSQKKVKGWIKK